MEKGIKEIDFENVETMVQVDLLVSSQLYEIWGAISRGT
jgi:hypothetical protein